MSPLVCLAMAVYFEARGEPAVGQIAVAQVIIERSFDPAFPNDLCGVVQSGRVDWQGNPLLNQCAFSFWCDGKKEEVRNEDAAWRAVFYSLAAFVVPPVVDNATFYHENNITPWWAKDTVVTGVVNNHVFRKPK